jgi:hypothetical protein
VDELETFFRELDRRYSLQLIPRVRIATITDAASPTSYSLTFPGEVDSRSGVPSVSAVVPQVGQLVRVALVGDDPVITEVLGGAPILLQASISANESTTSTSYTNVATTGPTVTTDLVAGQSVLVHISSRASISTGVGHGAVMSFSVSGVESLSAIDDNSVEIDDSAGATMTKSTIYTAGVTGSHTFQAKYKQINGGTALFADRRIIVSG